LKGPYKNDCIIETSSYTYFTIRDVFPRWIGWLFGWLFRAAPSFAGKLKKMAVLMRATAGHLHFSRQVDMRGGDGVSAEALLQGCSSQLK
jgi:hypothetical protein